MWLVTIEWPGADGCWRSARYIVNATRQQAIARARTEWKRENPDITDYDLFSDEFGNTPAGLVQKLPR